MAKQVEKATIVGTITLSGNAKITVTAAGMNNTPKDISVAVTSGDSDVVVAQAVRYALATDADVSAFFSLSGTGADVILTARNDAANDDTMNVASANDTCAGLTDEPTSTTTTPGSVVILNGYITLDEFHSMKRIKSDFVTDDSAITFLIESASRYVDHNTSRRFYLNGQENHYFNVPGWEKWIENGSFYSGFNWSPMWNEPKLMLDNDLFSVTTVTNGDGTLLTLNTDYVLYPYNATPHYAIVLMNNNIWRPIKGSNPMRAITVGGEWGYCAIADVPGDLKEAVYMISMAAYNRRLGENMTQKAVITAAGAVISPEDVPAKAADIIRCHQRISFG